MPSAPVIETVTVPGPPHGAGRAALPPRRRVGRLLLALAIGLAGCGQQEAYHPPDLLYLFASYKVGKNPTSVTPADLDRDGITDLITTNIGDNTLSILFGNGDGSFREQVSVEAAKEPRALALADYNGDGLLDAAVACSGSDQVAVFFGIPGGTFRLEHRYAVHRTPVSIAAGDVNGDGKADLLVALRNDKLKMLFGNGDGSFRDGPQYEFGDTPTSLAATDLNGDGKLDIAVSNGGPMSSAVSIWLGRGDGTFRGPTDYRTGKRPLNVGFADFNGDRVTDLLVINGERDTFTVFLGNGDGTFKEGQESGADAGPVYGVAWDFDGDHLMDVAIANIQSNNLSILYGRGDGTFRYPPMNYRAKGGPFAMATLHIRTDEGEEPGLAVADNGNGTVTVFLHRGLKGASPAPPAAS